MMEEDEDEEDHEPFTVRGNNLHLAAYLYFSDKLCFIR